MRTIESSRREIREMLKPQPFHCPTKYVPISQNSTTTAFSTKQKKKNKKEALFSLSTSQINLASKKSSRTHSHKKLKPQNQSENTLTTSYLKKTHSNKKFLLKTKKRQTASQVELKRKNNEVKRYQSLKTSDKYHQCFPMGLWYRKIIDAKEEDRINEKIKQKRKKKWKPT